MPPVDPANQRAIAEIQDEFRKAIEHETAVAFKHQSDAYYTDSRGHNVGGDEMTAVIFAGRLVLTPGAAELADPLLYATRLMADLESIKGAYRVSQDDPEGYGIGTLHGFSRVLEPFIRSVR